MLDLPVQQFWNWKTMEIRRTERQDYGLFFRNCFLFPTSVCVWPRTSLYIIVAFVCFYKISCGCFLQIFHFLAFPPESPLAQGLQSSKMSAGWNPSTPSAVAPSPFGLRHGRTWLEEPCPTDAQEWWRDFPSEVHVCDGWPFGRIWLGSGCLG